MTKHPILKGALIGAAVGLAALAGVFAVAWRCLPYRIAYPPPPWPWYCADPAYGAILFLAFPVNLLTNDLGRAVLLAPLALPVYALIGAGLGRRAKRS